MCFVLSGDLGLGDPVPNFLHSHHGALQRRLQIQNIRGRVFVGRRFNSGRHFFHRHRTKFSHNIRGSGRWSRLRSQDNPNELPQVLVCYRPVIVFTVRCFQRIWPRRRCKHNSFLLEVSQPKCCELWVGRWVNEWKYVWIVSW